MFYSIKSKLILLIILLLAFISAFIFLFFPGRFEEMQMEALKNNSFAVNKLISYSLSPALYFGDNENINEVISGARQNKSIAYIMVHSKDGFISGYNTSLANTMVYNDIGNPIDLNKSVYKTKEPVIHNNNVIGYLYTGYSLSEINKQILESRYAIAFISIILFLVGSLIVYFISKYSFKTLIDVIATTKKVSAGDMSIRATETNDEIGEVARTFNQMMNEVESYQNKLTSWNKALEDQVRKRTIDLENEIEERKKTEIELIKAKETAEEMVRLKTNFLANMSHELRTPLIGIIGYADFIQNDALNEEIKEMASIIKKSGSRLHFTLNQFLDLSKLESEKGNFKLSKNNIIPLIEESVTLYTAPAKEKELNLIFIKSQPEVFAMVEQSLFINLINNLLNNAVKYTHSGRIIVNIYSNKDGIKVEVKDTGVGIPDEKIQLIFEPFRQASEGFGRNYEGTGLGLTLTKKYAEMMNGRIEVVSSLNEGSTFTLILPALLNENNISEITLSPEDSDRKIKLLLIEDEEVSIKTISMYLSQCADQIKGNYTLEVVNNSEKAMELVNKNEYDIILLDIALNGKYNGIDIVNVIRKNEINAHKPVVAVTAYAMPGDKDRFINAGFSHYLSKPFYQSDLLNLLEKILIKEQTAA